MQIKRHILTMSRKKVRVSREKGTGERCSLNLALLRCKICSASSTSGIKCSRAAVAQVEKELSRCFQGRSRLKEKFIIYSLWNEHRRRCRETTAIHANRSGCIFCALSSFHSAPCTWTFIKVHVRKYHFI
jgi:hypothetical protein